MRRAHFAHEHHRTGHIGWLRAAVLGANDGIVSTASLIVGVAAAHAGTHSILVSGASGLVAGAMSMAAGEYVSVSSQADTEDADLGLERRELSAHPRAELAELASIYVRRGLDHALAKQVAAQLMAHDALGAHARDELGISSTAAPRPRQAALASAASFSAGAALPLLLILVLPQAPRFLASPSHPWCSSHSLEPWPPRAAAPASGKALPGSPFGARLPWP